MPEERKSARKPSMAKKDLPKSNIMVKVVYKDGHHKYSPADHLQFRTSNYEFTEEQEKEGILDIPDSQYISDDKLTVGMVGFAIWGNNFKYYPATIGKVNKPILKKKKKETEGLSIYIYIIIL